MTTRDRILLIVAVSLLAAAGGWFLLLSPVRKDAAAVSEQITTAQTRLTAAQASLSAGSKARAGYLADYATVARLGKAVPADDDVPSLVVQLQSAAEHAKVDFRSIELAAGSGAAAPIPASTQSAAVGAAASSTGATGAAGATGTPAAAAPAAAAPATQAAAAVLPPGAAVGSAGFPTMPFDFTFNGSFFHLQDFLGSLDRFTRVRGDKVDVSGRLLSVDGFSLAASQKGFPAMVASVHATAYLLPAEQAAATPAAIPATAAPAAPATASTPATPAGDATATTASTK